MPPPKKMFIPLENNPKVFTHLLHTLGASPSLTFHDIYSLTSPTLLSPIPRPVHALIFICPAATFHRARDAENEAMPLYKGTGANPMWFKQTIGNACGLIALLHAVCNGVAKKYITEGSDLEKLYKEAVPLEVDARADLLYNSEALEKAHMEAALLGDSPAPSSEERCGLHFIAFVKGEDGRLWELNGGMKGPVDRGMLGEREDALSEKALDLGVKTFLRDGEGNGDVRFSIVALAGSDGV
ncbi:MAG: ubiquitinyl hydrolase 1 [Candelina mexicana]|nr:MAG: ubiquitinyl hydrolase 1 [Candelina mexicana]